MQRVNKRNKPLEQIYKEEIEKGQIQVFEGSSNIYLAMLETLKDKCAMVI